MNQGNNKDSEIHSDNEMKFSGKGCVQGTPSNRYCPEIIVRVNKKGEHLFYTNNIFSFFKIRKRNLIGLTISESQYLPEVSQNIETLLQKAFESKKQQYKELSFSKNNKSFHISTSITPEVNETGIAESAVCVFRDILQEKTREGQLNDLSKEYDLAIEASDLGIIKWDIDNDSLTLSRKWKMQVGYFPDELEDNLSTWMKLLHHEDYNRVKRELDNFLNNSAIIFESEFRLRHKDGNYRWFKNRSAVIRNENGTAVCFVGTNRDFTDEKIQLEKQMLLQQVFNSSTSSIMITDLDGYIEYLNPAFCKTTGYTADELIGKKPNTLKSGHHTKSFYRNLWDTIQSGIEWRGEIKNKRKDGRIFWEVVSISCLKNEKGIITNYLKISEDITSTKKLQEELRKAKHNSKNATQYKNNFLTNMSYEIRTPINGIIGFSELLKYGDLTVNQQLHYIDIIEESSRSLLSLVDDIIDVSKIESKELKIKKEACSLTATLSELEDHFRTLLKNSEKPNIVLKFKTPAAEHHDFIFTDPFRLKQVLSNLFLNALKFTEKGFIEVGYQVSSEKVLQFYVEDTGIGISEEDQRNLFKKFIQDDRSIKSKEAGAGLGLYISQGVVELLGGNISFRSKKKKGSLFFFTIPYDKIRKPLTSRPEPKSNYHDFSKFTILIAEDIDYNYEYLQEILAKTKAKILWAKDGIDTINIYNNNKVDLILMDIQLPEVNGYEVTKTIRETNSDIPIIAQTAYAMSEERKKCLQAGCNDVLIKPLKIDEVLNTVAEYLLK